MSPKSRLVSFEKAFQFIFIEISFLFLTDVIDELNVAQVEVHHVSTTKKKNAADEKLRQALRRFVDTFSRITVVLISGDSDFLADLSDVKYRKAGYVVLLHNGSANDMLKQTAHEAMDFHKILADIPSRPQSQAPFKFTELLLSNIPSSQEMPKSEVTRKLEELSKAWNGKIKFRSDHDGTAGMSNV